MKRTIGWVVESNPLTDGSQVYSVVAEADGRYVLRIHARDAKAALKILETIQDLSVDVEVY